ncbi:hypothetical protein AAEH92_04995 [Shewanella xiamenensis]|uniref:hypothetical protein n=1 Tax=Shewanella xiamenensis TaxID=332186 RepID=UPI00313B1157
MSTDKKSRKEMFTFTTKEHVSEINFIYDKERDIFILPEADPNSIRVERSYERNSGKPKILSSVQAHRNFAALDVDTMLTKEYNYLISIDTNSREYDGKNLSICTCYQVPGKLDKFIDGVPFHHLISYVIVNPSKDINPEIIGWHLVIEKQIKVPFDNGKGVMAIVVDSEKDLLSKFNSGELPYFKDHYLPSQLKFCYASDKDKDTLSGQMLKMCHNVSNQVFRHIQTERKTIPLLTNGNGFCDGYLVVKGTNA